MATTMERQQELLRAALKSLHAIADLSDDQTEQDRASSQCGLDLHRQAKKSLEHERRRISNELNKLAQDTQGLRSRESALQFQLSVLQDRKKGLQSQIFIQHQIAERESSVSNSQWNFHNILPFLDAKTVIACSLVCKKWRNELFKVKAFLQGLRRSPAVHVKPDPINNDLHLKFSLMIFQLDKFSYICDLKSARCISCVSTVKTDESRLIIYICEREPSSYLKELVFARSALAIDRCIQDMNSNNAVKRSLLVKTKAHYELLLLQKEKVDVQLAKLSKSVLDLKTQCASDSHTLMFLERELESMSHELKFCIEREKAKRAELLKLIGENRQRRLEQEHQRNLLLNASSQCGTAMSNINV